MAGKRISTSRRINQKGKKSKCAETVRAEIYKVISENPGLCFSEIKSKVKRGNGTVNHHLHILKRAGLIVSRISGRRKLYWIKQHRGLMTDEHRCEICQSIVDLLREREGGLTVREIADRLGMSHQRVCYHLKKLELKGILQRRTWGRRTLCLLGKNRGFGGDSQNYSPKGLDNWQNPLQRV